jgi:hypothetical protein
MEAAMYDPTIIHVEHISHDPLLGRVSGTVVRREAGGDVSRHRLTVPVDRAALPHSEADARLREEACARGTPRG